GDKFGNFEATAYIQAKGSIQFFTLSARDQDSFQRALSAFDSVVTSYEDLKKPRTNESAAAPFHGAGGAAALGNKMKQSNRALVKTMIFHGVSVSVFHKCMAA